LTKLAIKSLRGGNNVYKVVLVDDEDIVLEGLKKKINWERLGLEVVGIATDGLEALKTIEKTNPDILITDVIMPIMDGLKLIETLKEMGKDIKAIILSGHDEFAYAQRAVKLQAAEYQLKPISITDMESILEKITNELDAESREAQTKSKLKRDNKDNSEMLKQHLFSGILNDKVENSIQLISKIEDLNKGYLDSKLIVTVAEIDNHKSIFEGIKEKEKELIVFSVLNIINEIVESNNSGFAMRLDERRIAIITFYSIDWNNNRISNSYVWLFCLIKDNVKKYLGYPITMGVGPVVLDIMDARESFLKAEYAVKCKLIYGGNRIIKYEDIKKNEGQLLRLYVENEKKMFVSINNLEEVSIFTYIDMLHKQTVESNICSYEEIIQVCYKLVIAAKSVLNSRSVEKELIEDEIMLLEQIKDFEQLESLFNWIKDYFKNIFEVAKSKDKRKYNSIINYIVENIEKNYMSDIELNNIAKKLFLSANYLSTLFKKETGVSFKSYLTNHRLQKAKELLLDPHYKIYQIANIVGYENEEYLCRLFKNNYGVTCKEFRDNNMR